MLTQKMENKGVYFDSSELVLQCDSFYEVLMDGRVFLAVECDFGHSGIGSANSGSTHHDRNQTSLGLELQ